MLNAGDSALQNAASKTRIAPHKAIPLTLNSDEDPNCPTATKPNPVQKQIKLKPKWLNVCIVFLYGTIATIDSRGY